MPKEQSKPFDDFIQFYEEMVKPIKKQNPMLKGQINGGTKPTRTVFARFVYKECLWKIDADTYVEKLDAAYQTLLSKKTHSLFNRPKETKIDA